MATGPSYTVRFRRIRNGKTNYHQRLSIIKSQKTRLVIRKTNKHIICQLIKYNQKGDLVLASVVSGQLAKLGWKHNLRNIPASYLTGIMIAKLAEKSKVKEAILDIGRNTSTKGSVLYAALKGAVDGGINIPHDESVLPTEDRIYGKHTKAKDLQKEVEAIKKKIGVKNDAK